MRADRFSYTVDLVDLNVCVCVSVADLPPFLKCKLTGHLPYMVVAALDCFKHNHAIAVVLKSLWRKGGTTNSMRDDREAEKELC